MTRIQPSASARRLLAAIVALTLATGLAVVRVRSGRDAAPTGAATADACLPGVGRQVPEADGLSGVAGAALSEGVPESCLQLPGLDGDELMLVASQLAMRFGADTPDALADAIAQKGTVARTVRPVKGGAAAWEPVGKTPLLAIDPEYETYAQGQPKAAGRISDFALDERRGRILAAVASGGVYATSDFGES
jgi:hypothetical protein